jgi:hypothetical protein
MASVRGTGRQHSLARAAPHVLADDSIVGCHVRRAACVPPARASDSSVRVLATIAVIVCAGCEPLPPVAFTTDHFVVRAYDDAPDREVYGRWLELHRETISAYLGVTPPATIEIQHLPGEPCGHPGGCERDGTIRIGDEFEMLPHELVHAYLRPLGASGAVLAEGLATMLGCAGDLSEPPPPSRELLDWAGGDDFYDGDVPRHYGLAGSFTRHLVEVHGIAAVVRLYAATPGNAPYGQLDDAFRSVLGASLEESVDGWVARGGPTGVCLYVAECGSGAPLEPGAPHTLDPSAGPLRLADLGSSRTFLPLGIFDHEGGPLRISMRGERGYMEVYDCVNGYVRSGAVGRGEAWMELPRGRYFVEPRSTYEMEWLPAPGLVTAECSDDVPVIDAPFAAWWPGTVACREGCDAWLAFTLSRGYSVAMDWATPPLLCAGPCTGAESCVTSVPADGLARFEAGDPVRLPFRRDHPMMLELVP